MVGPAFFYLTSIVDDKAYGVAIIQSIPNRVSYTWDNLVHFATEANPSKTTYFHRAIIGIFG
jgi:hypothetical protein